MGEIVKDLAARRLSKAESNRREKFCLEYVMNGGNATRAYLHAYSRKNKKLQDNSAATEGWRLLKNPEISQHIKDLKKKHHEILMTSYEESLQEMASLAMFDPGDLFHDDGTILPMHEMTPAARKSVQEVVVNDGVLVGVKAGRDKAKYMEMMMKHYNAYEEHQKAGTGEIKVLHYHESDKDL